MAWDCRHKTPNGECYRLGKPCAPGDKGCVLYGKFVFPFKDEKETEKGQARNDAEDEDQ